MTRPRWAPLLEITGFYGLILFSIWFLHDAPFRPPLLAAGLLLIGVCVMSNHWHKDSRRAVGLDPTQFYPSVLLVLKVVTLPLLAFAGWAALHPPPPLPKILFGLFGYPLWAFAQEYALLAFLANRLKDVLGDRPWRVALVNGILFSLVHMPNPLLVGFCLVGGIAFTRIFQKTPHLVPIALAHAAAGFLVSWIFQDFYPAMMIGPAYLRWARIAGH